MPLAIGIGIGLSLQGGAGGGGADPVPERIMMSSRGRLCGNGGGSIFAGSNGTDTDSNTVIKMWNDSGATVTEFEAVFEGARCSNNGEVTATNGLTVWASIEYPIGSGRQVFASAMTVLANENKVTAAFTLATPIPPNEAFLAYTYVSVSSGQVWPQNYEINTSMAEAADFATGSNKTASGTITNATATANRRGYGPTAIVATAWTGTIKTRAIVGIGDSRMSGNTASPSARGNSGSYGRGLDGVFPFLNAGFFSAAVADNLTMTRRLDLYTKCGVTDAIIMYGTNDLTSGGQSAAQIWANIQNVQGQLEGIGVLPWISTIDPRVATVDDYLDTANMTANGASYTGGVSSIRHELVLLIRAGSPGGRVVDTAAATEAYFTGSGVLNSSTTLGGTPYFRAVLSFGIDGSSTTTSLDTDTTTPSPSNLYSTGNGRLYMDTGAASPASNTIATGPNASGVTTLDVPLSTAPGIGDTGRMIPWPGITTDGVHLSAGTEGSNYSGQKFVAETVVRPLFSAL